MFDNLHAFAVGSLELEYALRLLLAVCAGAVVGVEREFRGRPAGLRTHILVALGAAIISVASIELAGLVNVKSADYAVRTDISRLAAGMITGIGFLGAGTIIKMGKSVRGLTTAASVWGVASVGMGFGFGFYRLSFLGAMFMMFTLIGVNRMERGINRDWYKSVTVVMAGPREHIWKLRTILETEGWRVLDLDLKKDKSDTVTEVIYELRLRDKSEVLELAKVLEETEYVRSFQVA